ncbi:MAG: Bro-N domain-containing protein [Thermoplasmatota archaeon]
MKPEKALVAFQGKTVRRRWFEGQWYFSVIDIIAVLSESENPRSYWKVLKHRLKKEGSEVVTKCNQLKLPSSDGKSYKTDCANTETVFRLIQSIPSKKAEPFKRWLAKVGYERIQEIDDPELAMKRMKAIYRSKGYSEEWIEKRSRGIAIRNELTEEWEKRGVSKEREYSILTAEISDATFGMTPAEYRKFKDLDKENLRDHMNDLELIFTMLGEASTTEIARNRDAQGFDENKTSARKGGTIAGNARKDLEIETGRPVSSKENFLVITEKKEKIAGKKGRYPDEEEQSSDEKDQ